MSKKSITQLKPEEELFYQDEENFLDNNDDDYEKEDNNVSNNTNKNNASDSNIPSNNTINSNNNTTSNNNDTHNAIKQRLLKMEAETKKITQIQNKYDTVINNNINNTNNKSENFDNENDEIVEIYSNSSNHNNNGNNFNELNEEMPLLSSSSPQKSKISNTNTDTNTNTNANTTKSNEPIDEQNATEYPSFDDQRSMDERSIFINNLHAEITTPELQQLFSTCGTIERITIVCNKWTGRPKGCAYIQFKSKEAIDNAVMLNEKEVKGKKISVEQKRTNLPKWLRSRGGIRSRGRGMIGRGGRGRGFYMPPYYVPEVPPMMIPSYGYYRGEPGGGRGYRSRGYWNPY